MTDDAYARMGYAPLEPMLQAFAIPCTSSASPIDRQIMLANQLDEIYEARNLHADCDSNKAALEESLADAREACDEANELLDSVRADYAKLFAEHSTAQAQLEKSLIDAVDLMAERDTFKRQFDSLRGFVLSHKSSAKIYAKWLKMIQSEPIDSPGSSSVTGVCPDE